ncbi:ABC transporter ATP-binding protein [Sulfobacillus harzensis]|uniref:sn-glycerol-3-phosphate ABC transporter ATP-binding protein UgpC n=1 Tax=Sulfobacillus harzensis TaxID=2729629 RepID=A0A7Y0L583_9FIRM|nr:sn-glycerol-3-phosphate ABC transporter ATP-binding protein UgpC [Sulfobacillus harzensis]NMP23182.1 sn-glycerol-3-phosphate ABC transporter ATP-binding protein UgpC [Sulfobacillus harzensis]
MAELNLYQVKKDFGAVTAVHDVTLNIADREFLVLLGPSGCGKTTTLRMVAGLEDVTSGSIHIGGRDVTHLEPKDRDIAMVFQNYALYPHMTVYENMAFGLKLRRFSKTDIERRVKDASEILGLGSLLKRRPKELSGGQRQRVALGRAIVREPQAFLMDEPLSNLDAQLRTQTRVELKRLHERLGSTTVYVTHDQTEAMTMGTRIVVMRDGVIQQVDTPENIYHRPANEFVATFVGMPPMNLLTIQLESQGNEHWGRVGRQRFSLPSRVAHLLRQLSSNTVTMGIRPEDLSMGNDPGVILNASVRMVESLGHERLIYCDVEGTSLVVRAANDWQGDLGETMSLCVREDRLCFFDPVSQRLLG